MKDSLWNEIFILICRINSSYSKNQYKILNLLGVFILQAKFCNWIKFSWRKIIKFLNFNLLI